MSNTTKIEIASARLRGADVSLTRQLLLGAVSLGALATVSAPAMAQEDVGATTAGDAIIVTASRRASDVSTIPYNITAVGGDQLEATGVSDVQDLSQQIPNLNIGSNGARYLVAQVPIIRGLNASSTIRPSALAQPPVTIYLNNVAVGGYFPLDDIQRVEVLRGPQGTLYGGGSLGGTIRMITNEPAMGMTEGYVTGSIGVVSHSSDVDYSFSGMINVPLGETLALRVTAKHQYEAGFIDKLSNPQQEDGPLSPAVLATPGDIAGSLPVYADEKDYNWAKTTSTRAALRWEPSPDFEATATFAYSRLRGEGGPVDNSGFAGATGVYVPDPSLAIPALGDYEDFRPGMDTFERDSYLAALDMSYDMGFATLSSTTSYLDTKGVSYQPGALQVATLPPFITAYYIGIPAFPRYLFQSPRTDTDKNFVQEIRLVSNGDTTIQYTVGAYYQHEKIGDQWLGFQPGYTDYLNASGAFGFPNPLVNDQTLDITGRSTFEQIAAYGELTWSPVPELQVTGGIRVFDISFDREATAGIFGYPIIESGSSSFSTTDAIFKGNVSYEFVPDNMVYATFSQGFRRGGANAFSVGGFIGEPTDLLAYTSDTVDNYEIGIKGRFGAGWRYNFDIFNVEWQNPQIDTFTPVNQWPVVVNGDSARSRGIEVELSGPLTDDLMLVFGYAYADAKLTSDFCLPSADGFGGIDPCGILGFDGDRLPGAPKHTASGTLSYDRPINDTDSIGASLNVNYKGNVLSGLPSPTVTTINLPDYFLVNASVSYTHGPISVSLYARNLFDKRAPLGFAQRITAATADLNTTYNVTTPRQVGVTARFDF